MIKANSSVEYKIKPQSISLDTWSFQNFCTNIYIFLWVLIKIVFNEYTQDMFSIFSTKIILN